MRPATARRLLTATAPAWLGALCLASCSVLPPRAAPLSELLEVEVSYHFDGIAAPRVVVPASRPGLTVLDLSTSPPGVAETFEQGVRYLTAPGGQLRLRCRYRVEGAPDERPSPELLFPGATELRTLSTNRAAPLRRSGLSPEQG